MPPVLPKDQQLPGCLWSTVQFCSVALSRVEKLVVQFAGHYLNTHCALRPMVTCLLEGFHDKGASLMLQQLVGTCASQQRVEVECIFVQSSWLSHRYRFATFRKQRDEYSNFVIMVAPFSAQTILSSVVIELQHSSGYFRLNYQLCPATSYHVLRLVVHLGG